jgi:aspartate beta-hydroxylase
MGRRSDAETEVRDGYAQLIDSLFRRDRPDAAREVAGLAVAQGLWKDPLQRPVDYEPSGSDRAVHDPASFWFVEHLRAAQPRIRAEIDAVAGPDGAGFAAVEEPLVAGGRWNQVILYEGGRRQEQACARFPVTAAAVEQIPEATTLGPGVVTLSWLSPGTRVVPHCGRSNARLRVHLGIRVPPGPVLRVGREELRWTEGGCLVFDDSFEHEVRHDGDRPRLVLLLDVPYPGLDEQARRRVLADQQAPSARIAAFLAAHDIRRVETDATGVVLRPGAGTESLILRYLGATGASAVEMRDGRHLTFE